MQYNLNLSAGTGGNSRELRLMRPALLARLQDNKMLINVRTLINGDDELIVRNLQELIKKDDISSVSSI